MRPSGRGELRTGIRCLDSYHSTGRKKTEELCPAIKDHTRQLLDTWFDGTTRTSKALKVLKAIKGGDM